jgi:hypothetical protein
MLATGLSDLYQRLSSRESAIDEIDRTLQPTLGFADVVYKLCMQPPLAPMWQRVTP